ncbi:MAG: diphosphate--fructose-6-phosphate 1-phosphotransferase [Simkaniaceae bacterium]|nr:diphosphate--fructose-6-phosphate 1-phosphotransferase [Simkaniaceae bacterium]
MRELYIPQVPASFQRGLTFQEGAKTDSLAHQNEIKALFPHTYGQGILLETPLKISSRSLRVGVVFSGGQASGGHNVISALFDSLHGGTLFGFLGGPSGIVEGKFKELTQEMIAPYRNQGGFDLLGSGRTKIETEEQLQASLNTCLNLKLDGLVIVGGDDSNTNAAILSEYFLGKGCATCVIGVPKTIDGDLQNEHVAISFGFDTATKVYSEMIGNIERDALSAKKYTHFIKLMGRSASHIALECAFKTHPNLTLIGEEVASKKMTVASIVTEIADLVEKRASLGKNYGVILIPEGLIEFIPEKESLIRDLHLELDPHGNIQVSHIHIEKILIEKVSAELQERGGAQKFNPVAHFFGYEGRAGYPSNFDANYCYALGCVAASLLFQNKTGYMACVKGLSHPSKDWKGAGIPITSLLNMEIRKGISKPVIQKALVNLSGKPFQQFEAERQKWELEDDYRFPEPIQFYGPSEIIDSVPHLIAHS